MSNEIRKNISSSSDNTAEIDLSRVIGVLLDYRWLILAITSVFTLLGLIYALLATPIYKADALIQVEQNMGSSILNDISQVLPNSQPASAPEIELLKSRYILGKAVSELGLDLDVSKKYFPVIGKGWARITKEKDEKIALNRFTIPKVFFDKDFTLKILSDKQYELLFDGETIINGTVGEIASTNDGVSILVSAIDASPGTEFTVSKTSELIVIANLLDQISITDKGKDIGMLSLAMTGSDPAKIKRILEVITRTYLEQNIERKSEEAAKSLVFLEKKLPDVSSSLDSAENKLNKFRQENDSIDLTLEAKSVLDTLVQLDAQLNELTFREAEISKLYTKDHPSYKALLEKRQTLEEDKVRLNKKINALPKTQQEILTLTRNVQANQAVYMQLLNKQQELSISKASTVGNVRIIDEPVTYPIPVAPKKVLIIILMTVIGAIVSSFCVLIRSALHKGISSPEQLENEGLNVYASIPISDSQTKNIQKIIKLKGNKQKVKSELLAVYDPADLAIEAIRSLRTSLHFAMMGAKNNAIMISGASPGIGKSFVSANLAGVIAQSGQKVLIIDGDLRKGYVHKTFNSLKDDGVSDVLSGIRTVSEVIQKTEIDKLDFIGRGQIPPNPSELLMSNAFDDLVNWGCENYDLVVIDTPPILAVTDAAIIAKSVGAVLLVAKFEENTVKEIKVSIRRFEQNGIEIKGVILNAMVKRASNTLAGYGYYQYSYSDKK